MPFFHLVLSALIFFHIACSTSPMPGRDAGSGGFGLGGTGGTLAAGGQGGSTQDPVSSVSNAAGGTSASGAGETGPGSSLPSSGACPDNSVCFRGGRAQGLMSGWAWVDMGTPTTMSSPSCGANQTPITSESLCPKQIAWSTSDSLCATGLIPAAKWGSYQQPADDWGMEIGVNVSEPNDAVGSGFSSFKRITFTLSGEPQRGLRAFVHRKNDPAETTYCYESIISGKDVDLSKFNTKCWGDTSTVDLKATDLPMIDQIGILISSSSTAITVNDFCLTQISFQ